ncbi:MAG: relaxase domain-containing protein [Acidobacteria bacterium]|nr:relaxase domain-containing protein [Acidobacteriota bacterium]
MDRGEFPKELLAALMRGKDRHGNQLGRRPKGSLRRPHEAVVMWPCEVSVGLTHLPAQVSMELVLAGAKEHVDQLEACATRSSVGRRGNKARTKPQPGRVLAVVFPHDTERTGLPHPHPHIWIMPQVWTEDKEWKTLDNAEHCRRLQREGGRARMTKVMQEVLIKHGASAELIGGLACEHSGEIHGATFRVGNEVVIEAGSIVRPRRAAILAATVIRKCLGAPAPTARELEFLRRSGGLDLNTVRLRPGQRRKRLVDKLRSLGLLEGVGILPDSTRIRESLNHMDSLLARAEFLFRRGAGGAYADAIAGHIGKLRESWSAWMSKDVRERHDRDARAEADSQGFTGPTLLQIRTTHAVVSAFAMKSLLAINPKETTHVPPPSPTGDPERIQAPAAGTQRRPHPHLRPAAHLPAGRHPGTGGGRGPRDLPSRYAGEDQGRPEGTRAADGAGHSDGRPGSASLRAEPQSDGTGRGHGSAGERTPGQGPGADVQQRFPDAGVGSGELPAGGPARGASLDQGRGVPGVGIPARNPRGALPYHEAWGGQGHPHREGEPQLHPAAGHEGAPGIDPADLGSAALPGDHPDRGTLPMVGYGPPGSATSGREGGVQRSGDPDYPSGLRQPGPGERLDRSPGSGSHERPWLLPHPGELSDDGSARVQPAPSRAAGAPVHPGRPGGWGPAWGRGPLVGGRAPAPDLRNTWSQHAQQMFELARGLSVTRPAASASRGLREAGRSRKR